MNGSAHVNGPSTNASDWMDASRTDVISKHSGVRMSAGSWESLDEHEDTRAEAMPWLGAAEDPTARISPELARQLLAPDLALRMEEPTVVEGRAASVERASSFLELQSVLAPPPAPSFAAAVQDEVWAPPLMTQPMAAGRVQSDPFVLQPTTRRRRSRTTLSRLWFGAKLLTGSVAVMATSFMVSRFVHDPHFRADMRVTAESLWNRTPFGSNIPEAATASSRSTISVHGASPPRAEPTAAQRAEPSAEPTAARPVAASQNRSAEPDSGAPSEAESPSDAAPIPTVRVEDLPLLPAGCASEPCDGVDAPTKPPQKARRPGPGRKRRTPPARP